MIVVNTNVFVALSDRRDAHHTACRDWLAGCDEQLIVPPTVLAEACYMIDKYLGAESEAKFLDSVGIGLSYRFQLAELVDADLRRMAELVRRYADRRLGRATSAHWRSFRDTGARDTVQSQISVI